MTTGFRKWRIDPDDERFLAFWREPHFYTLTTLRADGSPHVVPVGPTLDARTRIVRVIASRASRKAVHMLSGGSSGARVAVCQVDGRRWVTLEGLAVVRSDPASVAEARYAERYRRPRPNQNRVVIEIRSARILGRL